jgi:hypothetical protein
MSTATKTVFALPRPHLAGICKPTPQPKHPGQARRTHPAATVGKLLKRSHARAVVIVDARGNPIAVLNSTMPSEARLPGYTREYVRTINRGGLPNGARAVIVANLESEVA